jgi:hypothetical protein
MATVSAIQHVSYTSDMGKTKVVSAHSMTAYEGVELQHHSFLTKALHRGGTSVSCSGLLNLRETVVDTTELETGWIQSQSRPFKEKRKSCSCKKSIS